MLEDFGVDASKYQGKENGRFNRPIEKRLAHDFPSRVTC